MEGEMTTSAPAPSSTSSTPASAPQSSPATTSSPTSYSNSSESSSSSSAPQQSSGESKVVAQSYTENGAGKQQLVLNPLTGKRVVKVINDSPVQQQPQQQNYQQDYQQNPQYQGQPLSGDVDAYIQQNNIQPQAYNIDEFSYALANGNVDERRVPEQYRQQYDNFRINQAVEQFNANQKALEQQKQATVEKQLTPEQRAQNMADFYRSLDKESSERAKLDANLSEEDLENLPYMDEDDPKLISYNMAKEFHRQQIMGELQNKAAEERALRAQQEQTYAGINNFVAEARAKEPNFDAIDVMMKERYKTLPYEAGQKIANVINALTNGTITETQVVELKEYYDNCRREYYAKRNGLGTSPQSYSRPPVVERAGGNTAPPQQYVPDYNALRNASGPRERRAWITQFMRAQANRNR